MGDLDDFRLAWPEHIPDDVPRLGWVHRVVAQHDLAHREVRFRPSADQEVRFREERDEGDAVGDVSTAGGAQDGSANPFGCLGEHPLQDLGVVERPPTLLAVDDELDHLAEQVSSRQWIGQVA